MKNIIFFGYGDLGTVCLKNLIDKGFNIIYILTHKDEKAQGVDTFAKVNDIPFSYNDLRKESINLLDEISGICVDYLVSINYRFIIPKEIFTIPKYSLNIHGSLLPKYRGRTPHVWNIINGEKLTGITCHLIDDGVDTGDIITQYQVKIEEEETGFELLKKFQRFYPTVLLESILKLENGEQLIKQDNKKASYFGKRTPIMGYIDFYKEFSQIKNFVRAQAAPYPGAYYFLNSGEKVFIHKISKVKKDYDFISEIGIITKKNGEFFVKCKDSIIKIDDIRFDN